VLAITRDAIDAPAFAETVADGAGGSVTFFGSVRGSDERGRTVEGLTYEAYEPMALAEFEAIAREARRRFGARQVAIVHRIGDVGVGEIAVAVTASADRRDAAFAACRYAIDEVKRRAPIWKKERYAGGAAEWIANRG
jgi:molybdopterin synthase catalytic subunit